jgi:hypothetical protein
VCDALRGLFAEHTRNCCLWNEAYCRVRWGSSGAQGATNHPERRLDSGKEIAAFLGRDERTVWRWEKESVLPVHRVPGAAKGRVFAYESELDLWLSTPQALRTTTLG